MLAKNGLDARHLTRRTEHCFEAAVRQRGTDYYRRGKVASCRGGSFALEARVYGSTGYSVRGEVIGPGELGVSCSCPYFEDGGFCKHLWAVFLEAEQRGLLGGVGGGSRPIELVDFEAVETDDDLEDDGFLAGTRQLHPVGPSSGRKRSAHLEQIGALLSGPAQALELCQPPTWRNLLVEASSAGSGRQGSPPSELAEPRCELAYVLRKNVQPASELILQIWARCSLPGRLAPSPWHPAEFHRAWLELLGEPVDRELYPLLGLGSESPSGWPPRSASLPRLPGVVSVPQAHAVDVMRRLCASGRCHLESKGSTEGLPLVWAGEEPWQLELEVVEDPTSTNGQTGRTARSPGSPFALRGRLVRGTEQRSLADVEWLGAGVVVLGNAAAPGPTEHAAPWLRALGRARAIVIPLEELEAFLRGYYGATFAPRLVLPPSLALTERQVDPEFVLDVLEPDLSTMGLPCRVSAVYGTEKVSLDARGARVVDFDARAVYPRMLGAEQQAKAMLGELGFRGRLLDVPAGRPSSEPDELRLAKKRLPRVVEALTKAGWRVLAQGKTYRRVSEFSIAVTTGLDWLGLEGGASFDGVFLGLPELLRALARRELTVLLDDGTLGILPEEWLERWGIVAEVAEVKDGTPESDRAADVRLQRAHVCLVDALLDTVQGASCDEAFSALRQQLRSFSGLRPAPAPAGFVGTLRPYQSEGLAWLQFLARLGFGGCLADDMGLGKTIQVLALLLERHAPAGPPRRARGKARARSTQGPGQRRASRPSLIVVPRSLVYNWIDEARRFAPRLRLRPHVGNDRAPELSTLSGYDVLVTSYGTLLRDLEQLREIDFDCIVLDEAQAIKTAGTQTAKAVQLLRGAVRLALTGTPVENHLGELWSLFDFLNPGLLGGARSLRRSVTRAVETGSESHRLLCRTIRPFVLRRTKAAVAADLPARSEETLWIDLDRHERRRYDELFRYYQARVRKRVALAGVARSTPYLLEALLRLRQAACHPGLIDPAQRQGASAKLEVLLEQVVRVGEEGHKALVFSQFTSLLSIVRERLDARGVSYEYLDGKTRDRPDRVARFQNDATVRLFLISLKAGGLGLNLTAADYVFILDPWWNPAVEAQAIDRTHRIGQSRQVFAYRLIARDTVEERVAELQQRKRKLVEAILGDESGLGGKLTRQDLEFLLR